MIVSGGSLYGKLNKESKCGSGPYASTVKVRMSSLAQRGQTTPTSHPLDPEEEAAKRGFRVK